MTKIDTKILHEFLDKLPTKVYQKNEIIVSTNQIHKHFYYVEKGIIRVFYYDNKGNDVTHWFTAEDGMLTILSSVYDKKISIYGIQALEANTTLKVASFDQFIKAKENTSEFQELFEQTIIRTAIKVANRLISIQTQTAKERYNNLLAEHPEIFQRVNLGHIASYLGMAQQSLSRIRAEK